MYVPKHNQMEDRPALLAYMRAYSFAALATSGPGGMTATHLPFVIEEEGGRITLLAHMAKANPQWRDFAAGGEALVIFMQPHGYVSRRGSTTAGRTCPPGTTSPCTPTAGRC